MRASGATRPRSTGASPDGLAKARRGAVYTVAVGVPVVFVTSSFDIFALPKYTVLVLAGLVLAVLGAVRVARDRSAVSLRHGLHLPVLGLLAWTALATLTSVSPGISVHGFARSFDGLAAIVALGVVLFTVAGDCRGPLARRLVTVVVLGAGGVVVGYGLLQVLETRVGGNWDPVGWSGSAFAGSDLVWSTFGNPNHLAGFLAMLLPLTVALALVRRGARWWGPLAGLGVGALGLLRVTNSRGAELAAVAGLAVTALLAGLVRGRLRVALAAAGTVVVVVAMATLALSAGGGLAGRAIARVDTDGKLVERSELWRAAWHMALDRPVVGFGPDTYRIPFSRYQSARYVARSGPNTVPNGPHNLLANTLATEGVPGLALLLSVLAVAALRVLGALRRLERGERSDAARRPRDRGHPARETRLLLAGASGAVVAWLTEASFNANVLALTTTGWVLLGLVVALTLDAEVPPTLDPRRLLAVSDGPTPEPEGPAKPEREPQKKPGPARRPASPARRPASPARRRGRRSSSLPGVVGIAGGVVALVLAWLLTVPWRADQLLWDAWPLGGNLVGLARQGQVDQARAAALEVLPRFERVLATNPWEPSYHTDVAELHYKLALGELSRATGAHDEDARARGLAHLEAARRQFEEALALEPGNASFLSSMAKLLATIDQADQGDDPKVLAQAEVTYRRAIEANPYAPKPVLALAQLYIDHGRLAEARAVLQQALPPLSRDPEILATLADIEVLERR